MMEFGTRRCRAERKTGRVHTGLPPADWCAFYASISHTAALLLRYRADWALSLSDTTTVPYSARPEHLVAGWVGFGSGGGLWRGPGVVVWCTVCAGSWARHRREFERE